MNTTLSAMQVALILSISLREVLHLARRHTLPSIKHKGSKFPRFEATHILAYVKGQQS